MKTPHDSAHDPYTGKPRQGMARLYGSMRVADKIKYCERQIDEAVEARIEFVKHELETMDKGDWRYEGKLHYVTVMPDVVAWTRAELSQLLALRDSTRLPRRRKTKP